jgi:EmrB/QacA subfamily drug resistance transporter
MNASVAAAESPAPVRTAPLIAGLMGSMFLVALDSTIVSTAMPTIAASLKGFALYAWVPSIYLLASAVTTPLYGKLSDLFGRKHILFFGIGTFIIGSAACGAAPTMLALIIFRAVQGVGAGAVFPVTMTIIGDLFSLEQRARMQGLFSSVWGVSSVAGPLVGGTLVDSIGWRWIFYINLPIGIVATLLIALFFRERRVHGEHVLDLRGATYLTTSLTSLLLLLIQGGTAWAWVSLPTLLLAVIGMAAMGFFLREETRAPEPLIPLNLFRIRIIAVSMLAGLFIGIIMVSVSFEVPLYVQGVLGQDAFRAGLALAPLSVGWPLAAMFSGKLAIRYGYRAVGTTGMLIDVVSVALLLTLGLDSSFAEVCFYGFFIGVGLGLCATPMLIAVQGAVSWTRRGIATATNMFIRSFGQVLGLAIMGAIINSATAGIRTGSAVNRTLDVGGGKGLPAAVVDNIHRVLLDGIHGAFIAALVAAILGTVVVTRLPGGSAREHELDENRSRGEAPAPVEEAEAVKRPRAG